MLNRQLIESTEVYEKIKKLIDSLKEEYFIKEEDMKKEKDYE